MNTGSAEANVQLELVAWSQSDGKDIYEPTRELLATPPIFKVPAKSSQVIRVGLRRPPDASKELSYRLYLQELPPPTPEGFTGLQMVLRMSVPVFVAPASGPAKHDLHWQTTPVEGGRLRLSVRNDGNGRAQVAALSVQAGDRTLQPGSMLYVLPGSTREWLLDADPALTRSATLAVKARINGVDTVRDVSLQ